MGTFRPAFRSVAQSLTDIDLVLVEEAFERLLLVTIIGATCEPSPCMLEQRTDFSFRLVTIGL